MRRNNRIIATLLAAVMSTFMITACGSTKTQETTATSAAETTAAETTASTSEKTGTRTVTDMKGVEVAL